jgi:hypothetical protein
MNIYVESKAIATNQVIYNDQGFGKPSGLSEVKYEICLSVEVLLERFSKEFDNYVLECKVDDEKYNNVDIPELKEANYPNLENALKSNSGLVSFLVKEYMYFNFFDQVLCVRERDNWKYAINSVSEVFIVNNIVKISGLGYWLSELN